eukprot:7379277-Prymnesium_polylepis.2
MRSFERVAVDGLGGGGTSPARVLVTRAHDRVRCISKRGSLQCPTEGTIVHSADAAAPQRAADALAGRVRSRLGRRDVRDVLARRGI